MAKKVKEETPEVTVTVTQEKPKRKTSSKRKTPVKAIEEEIDNEIQESTGHVDKLETIDVNNIPAKQKERYREIASVLNEKDLTSIASYGSDLQRAMSTYSNDFLTQHLDSKSSIESATLISNLLGELQQINIDDLEAPSKWKRFLRRLPIINKMVTSVEQIKNKYNTIEKNIDGIQKKLEATRQIAIRDNNNLQKQFENNCDYVDQLEELIIAGRVKSAELENAIENMKANIHEFEDYEISDMEEYKNSLDKRLTDLNMLRYAFKQSLTQIRIIQRTNIMDANNTESQIQMTIPLWRNQLSLGVALYNQKQSLEVSSKVADATNKILVKNSEMMKTQAIEVARQNQRTVLDIETLRKTTADLIATVEGVQKAQQEGAAKRAAAEAEISKLEKQMQFVAIGVQESTQRIVSKELQGIERK